MADAIDLSSLPNRALFDTTILVPALSPRRGGDPASRPLLEAMVRERKTVLVAAPSLAEMMRREPSHPMPRTPYIIVVAFDQRAAELLGTRFPPEVLTRVKNLSGGAPFQYIKYDAMIAACAMRHLAEALVTTDGNQRRVAEAAGIAVKEPKDYMQAQQGLF